MNSQNIPSHIEKNIELDKEYYSLYKMSNIERCKVDQQYLGDVMLVNENLIWHSIIKYIGYPDRVAEFNQLEKEDLFQLGSIGFIKAIRSFDTERGVKFSSFAVTAILREIKCYLRDNTGLIRLSRNVYTLSRKIKKIQNENMSLPSVEQLSQMLDVPCEKIKKAIEVGTPIKSLDEEFYERQCFVAYKPLAIQISDERMNVEDIAEDSMYFQNLITQAKKHLDDTEMKVLVAQLKGYTQTQIALNNNISLMRVNRILKNISQVILDMNIISKNSDE